MKNLKTWFTLVELLIVLTIVIILSTIAFLYLEWNISSSRDATRSYDLTEMMNTLELYNSEKWFFPDPSDSVSITYSWSAVWWKQWTFWESVGKIIKVYGSDHPTDPLFKNNYSYSVTAKWNEFQLWGLRENLEAEEGLWELGLVSKTHAASIETALVVWDYNGFMVKASDSGVDYFIATPSIIATDTSDPDIVNIISWEKLVYNEFFNLPESYAEFLDVNGGFNFNVIDPLVYSGNSSELKSEAELLEFNENLKYIYATTPTESFDKYIAVLEREWLTSLKWFLTRKFKISFRSYFNCKDILDDGLSSGSHLYEIDPDGPGGEDPYEVYCDMETDGWGWTRVWDNHVTNWDFEFGSGIVDAVENDTTTNEIVSIPTPIDSDYALHQTWNYSSNYQVWFSDTSILKSWYEVRMSLWRSDYGTWWVIASEWNDTKILGWKSNPWTIGTCTNGSTSPGCQFVGFNKKMLNSANFWPGWNLTEIDFSVVNPTSTITTSYLNWWILFDWFTPSSGTDAYGTSTYSSTEKTAIDEWVLAGWFLIATNDEYDYDPLWEYYDLRTQEYDSSWNEVTNGTNGEQWIVQNVDHPIVNGSIGLWVDLWGEILTGPYRKSALKWYIWPEDVVLAKENRPPYAPTVILRKHGKGHILITSWDGIFKDMDPTTTTFDSSDYETVFAAAIMAYAIETAANINPHEWYAFHNRIHYSDGTFSTNGEDKILETAIVDDGGIDRVWTREQTRHRVYKTPESFNWYIWLDANNNKDLYFTWVRLELFYR